MGRPANLHAQMAHSPAVLTAYPSLRTVLAEHTTFDPKVGINATWKAAQQAGWSDEHLADALAYVGRRYL